MYLLLPTLLGKKPRLQGNTPPCPIEAQKIKCSAEGGLRDAILMPAVILTAVTLLCVLKEQFRVRMDRVDLVTQRGQSL